MTIYWPGVLSCVFLLYLVLVSIFFIASSLPRYKPRQFKTVNLAVRVIIPCRGLDLELKTNLECIKNQDYSNFKVVAVVDSEDDPATQAITDAGLDHLVAGFQEYSGSGKVKAIATAITKATEDVIVIADSDITVRRDWLSFLVAPFSDPSYGVSTTFPVFKPVAGFWSRFKSVWGQIGQGMMETSLTRFGWGGSLAFRKSLIEGKLEEFLGMVSDDTFLTRKCNEAGLAIYYEPRAAPYILSNEDFSRFSEWSNRQTALLGTTGRGIITVGIAIYLNQCLLYVSAIALTIIVSPLYALFLAPYALAVIVSFRRIPFRFPLLVPGTFLLPFVYVTNLITASRMKEITWRDRTYSLHGGGKTKV